jgi:hypothetical protein
LPPAGYVDRREIDVALATAWRPASSATKAVITATVTKLKNGKPVPNQTVNWSLVTRQSPSDRLNKTQSTTNRQGVATVNLKFGPKAGKRTVRARMPGFKPTITVRCRGGLG